MNSDTTPLHDKINRLQSDRDYAADVLNALRAAREELYDLGFDSGNITAIARRDEIYAQIDAVLAGECEPKP